MATPSTIPNRLYDLASPYSGGLATIALQLNIPLRLLLDATKDPTRLTPKHRRRIHLHWRIHHT